MKVSFENADQKVLVLRNKYKLKNHATFKRVFIEGAKSHIERLLELNGRFIESDNNFTSVLTRGKAVVDYICVPHDVLEKCEYFKVNTMRSIIEDRKLTCLLDERSKEPDHSALITEICISHFSNSH